MRACCPRSHRAMRRCSRPRHRRTCDRDPPRHLLPSNCSRRSEARADDVDRDQHGLRDFQHLRRGDGSQRFTQQLDLPLLGHQSSREQVMDEMPGCGRHPGDLFPNIGRPMTSQCSASRPFLIRRMSTTTRFTCCPILENRPWSRTWSPSSCPTNRRSRAVGFGSARHVAEHRLATGGLQLAHLCVNALGVCGHTDITVSHRANYVHTHRKKPIFSMS